MREMAAPMKEKFDKYWGECNLLMTIASVLDPRCKFHIVDICFPMIYKPAKVAKMIEKVRSSLKNLYDEYVSLSIQESSSATENANGGGNNPTSSSEPRSSFTGFDQIMNLVREKEAVPPMKSELQAYYDEGVYVPDGDGNSFNALDWWRNNNFKYKVLSKMAADILAIPISTVASESTFSAGGRVIDEYHSKLNDESIEALIYGGDWLRHKYNLMKKAKVDERHAVINLKI
ncbi:zinc finger BED domain-containing protein RICESLEEPER 1-like [Lotus japonicus]|uniref:zinc finger BED domain-containing protein RICESLEEPER 1-like n=1 Tax=Lotus japonicus TaxID=34305 RepID=UPI0025863E4A|nr:zinc finger BED domain-containing protein RICESLEEPER 1-like [Lotus japonicus]